MWEVKVIKLGASVGSREDLKGGKNCHMTVLPLRRRKSGNMDLKKEMSPYWHKIDATCQCKETSS